MSDNTMKAVWYDEQGTPSVLQFGDIAKPVVAAGEVLVRMAASGVNPSDAKIRSGARGDMPFARQIPHSDGAGIVEAVGEGVDSSRVGERVWLWNAAIGRANGACAEYIALPSSQAVVLHDNTTFAQGACFGVPLMTATHAVTVDGDVSGQTILITGGAGAVGYYATQMAKLNGAKTIVTVSSDEKKAHAQTAAADCIINYKTEDVAAQVLEWTDGKGVDRIVEVEFGGNLHVSEKILKPNGIIAAYGSVAMPTPALPFYSMMFNNAILRLCFIYKISTTARKNAIDMIQKMEQDLTHAIAQTLPLSQTQQAHEVVEAGTQWGKIIVEV